MTALFNIFVSQTLTDDFLGLHKNMNCAFLFKSDPHLPKTFVLFARFSDSHLPKKCFLFHLKSSFRSQDIKVFVTTFWAFRKNDLIKKIRLTSKFMTSQPGLQTIAIHILPNISQSKGNQTITSGQLIEYNKRNIFLQKLCGK